MRHHGWISLPLSGPMPGGEIQWWDVTKGKFTYTAQLIRCLWPVGVLVLSAHWKEPLQILEMILFCRKVEASWDAPVPNANSPSLARSCRSMPDRLLDHTSKLSGSWLLRTNRHCPTHIVISIHSTLSSVLTASSWTRIAATNPSQLWSRA